jgi:hypothetical protein
MSGVPRPPAGWPSTVPAPGTPGWERRAVGYLLDAAPGEYRSEPVYRRFPAVLAWRVEALVEGQLRSARACYSRARAELGEAVAPEAVGEALAALEREGARLLAVRREVDLLGRALRGEAFVPRL